MREAEHFRIEGRVQGVGFRWWTVEAARGLGLAGWVRNRRDGSVEALAIGERAGLDAFAAACAKGPPSARVAEVVRTPAQDDGAQGFHERPTE
ncbi:acylphosphatase [Phenylobacterium sp. J367]|uniref:acylphosphatase n=1 Tax=Phenylobacterium sp. J367 TaxID=2898435 RepID=UPI002151EC98|nr:acylphosphatase [Phenylobacterium sp. J367]MCR5878182.1 acylphosphatase [Phenylobacterium sp. J367]